MFAAVSCDGNRPSLPHNTVVPDDSPQQPIDDSLTLIGTFIDGAVQGLSFRTLTQQGITNELGEFSYQAGEKITFSIGLTQFPTVSAASVLTPFQLAHSSNNPLATTLNIARLLQSLDVDGNTLNGIRISEQATYSASPIDFDVSPTEFESNPAVINLVANSGSVTTTLTHAAP